MKKLLLINLILVFITCFNGLASADEAMSPAEKIMTAIDVVTLMDRGMSDETIAKSLSDQRGFDREAAHKAGKSDQQIMRSLITDGTGTANAAGNEGSTQHRMQGDTYYKEAKYDKAALEYTTAMMSAKDKAELYMLRGDSYKQYLKTKLSAPPGAAASKEKIFLCCCIYSDYNKSMQINKAAIVENDRAIKVLRDKMGTSEVVDDANSELPVGYRQSSRNILSMRQINVLYNAQRVARSIDISLGKAISESKDFCGAEKGLCQE